MVSAHLKPKKKDNSVILMGECPVCLQPTGGTCHMQGLPCGHMFCSDCLVQHVLSKIEVGVSTSNEKECDCSLL